jgi:D-cysteine desulfhydrase
MAVVYPEKLKLAQLPTPLEKLPVLKGLIPSDIPSPNIWVKRDDLTGSATTGNKVRKLEYTLKAALNAGCDTIITCGGLQSNHCRATALLCAKLGLRCVLVLRGEQPDVYRANTFLGQLAGADIHCYSLKEYVKDLDGLLRKHAQDYENKGFKPWVIPTGASDGYGIWGYIECIEELQKDCLTLGITPSAICHATGSGGTQAGLTLGSFMHDFDVPIYGINVCDDAAYFQQKVREDIAHFTSLSSIAIDESELNIQVIDGYVGAGYAKASREVLDCIQTVASTTGIVFDPVYSGKAFYGLIEEIKKGRFADASDIVFIHTGGIFGLFDYEQQFQR